MIAASRTQHHRGDIDVRRPWQLRAAFARRLSHLYGEEVPAYLQLLDVTTEVNAKVLDAQGLLAQRLGGPERVGAERHGAIRVGSARELAHVAQLFAALGMHPVGYYDLRDSGVPVVSTAFRPMDADELELNPFRVFTSVLTTDDRRFFAPDLAARIHRRLAERELFPPELLALADRCATEQGLPDDDAARFLDLLAAAFQVDRTPIDRAWYDELHAVSAVAADIAGGPSTHINHLTPRVLDIEELHARMALRGIEMIPEIQGPPACQGPDVLLRQTSFKALAEDRTFRNADGSVEPGQLRVRFGEVEARGIALTPAGRRLYDTALLEADLRSEGPAERRSQLEQVWGELFPRTERALFLDGLGVFTARPLLDRPRDGRVPTPSLSALVEDGFITLEPVVYEDFLPRSAAGIFRSNLDSATDTREDATLPGYDESWLADALGCELHDPDHLYTRLTSRSLRETARALDLSPDAFPTVGSLASSA
jgi:uncharacterized glyoxalase superfamily metalloenzyme YdcJ